MCITKQIFEDENAAEYFQSTDQFIANYGFPCKIVNKFKIADIKIQTKK